MKWPIIVYFTRVVIWIYRWFILYGKHLNKEQKQKMFISKLLDSHSSEQNYFLIARLLIFCDIHDKSAVFSILRQNETIFYIGNREREEIERKWGNVESESLSISSVSLYFLFIFSFSLHFLAARVHECHNSCNPA